MSEQKKLGTRGEGWTLWASQEMEIGRQRRDKWVIVGAAVFIGLITNRYIAHLNDRIDYLTTNRQMFCENTGAGLYRSTDKRPKDMVMRFSREYMNNLKQFDTQTVRVNFDRALMMMSPEVAAAARSGLDQQIESIKKQSLSQWFTVKAEDVKEVKDGYVYTATARVGGHTGTTPIPPGLTEVTVRMRKVAPTESRPEGLVVVESRG